MRNYLKYIRVSTDEQADKGYSLAHQSEMLDRYASANNLNVIQTFQEDHSAKSFNRPEFQKLLLLIRKTKNISGILITKWDRFSRNAADAYAMLSVLAKLNCEVIAIEQPLDTTVPENKIMLAFYLACPEVENDRRALNVSVGMLRARKEGRYMGKAPIGYINVAISGKKSIVPSESAEHIKFIFETIASGKYATESVLKICRERGLKCSKNNFWNIISNPVYCGFIPVPAHKDVEAYWQKGLHEAIVSPGLFAQVQDVINGRKTKQPKIKYSDKFPLRGFIICPRCQSNLTASSSRNKKKNIYSYYHCNSTCGFRIRTELAYSEVKKELKKLLPHPAVTVLLKEMVGRMASSIVQEKKSKIKIARAGIEQARAKKERALNLLLHDQIAADDYSHIKKETEQRIFNLETEILAANEIPNSNNYLIDCMNVLQELPELFEKSTAEQKRELLCSIFAEKLEFSEIGLRTPKLNEALRLIFSVDAGLRGNKNGTRNENFSMSHDVNLMALFSNTVIFQMKKIAGFKAA